MAELDALTVSTRRLIREDPSLIDATFQSDPLLAYQRQNVRADYDGGYIINEPFIYQGLVGGAYLKGKEFDITERQVEQSNQFYLKYNEVNVTLGLEDIRVENSGKERVFSLVKSRMSTAFMTTGEQLAVAQYLNGQRAGYTAMMNGLAEAVNDGTTASWDNSIYTSYGTLTRNGTIGNSNNANVVNVNGAITYLRLSTSYAAATYGSIMPNIGITTPTGLVYIKNHFQPQQRFETVDPNIGFRGVQFEGAMILTSRYCPGSYLFANSGTGDANVVGFLTQSSNGTITAYPTPAVAASETLFWLNARKPYMNFYVAKDAMFGFGFTGFKWAAGNTKVAGQVLAGTQMTLSPRYHSQLYGFTS